MALVNNKKFGIRTQMIFSLVIIILFASFSFGIAKIGILIPHILVAVGIAYFSDSIIKYILGKKLYFNETALITGLIVASVINPDTPLLLTALISFVGILSKNFITVNKRHIFNPAGFGIVAVGLIFPNIFQSWWIGSQIIPIIILGLFLIYRLGRIRLLLSYLITIFILKAIFYLFSGNIANIIPDFFFGISEFFIFFMLIEPQTSTSIKHKKVIFGILVALFSFIFLNLPVAKSLQQNGILIGLLIANLYFILSQLYKTSQVKIFTNFIIISLFISIISYTNNEKNSTLNNISNEINNITKNTNSSFGTISKVIKINKTYGSPGGTDNIDFEILTEKNLVNSVKIIIINANETSKMYIDEFNNNINSLVKGKSISELKNINIVGGASLTTNAFKNAIKDM